MRANIIGPRGSQLVVDCDSVEEEVGDEERNV